MLQPKYQWFVSALTLAAVLAWGGFAAQAGGRQDEQDGDNGGRVKTVFVVAMENHNWTQPSTQASPQQILQNPRGR